MDSVNGIQLVWDETTGAIADFWGTYPLKITLAEADIETEIEDKMVLKSDYDALNEKVIALVVYIKGGPKGPGPPGPHLR